MGIPITGTYENVASERVVSIAAWLLGGQSTSTHSPDVLLPDFGNDVPWAGLRLPLPAGVAFTPHQMAAAIRAYLLDVRPVRHPWLTDGAEYEDGLAEGASSILRQMPPIAPEGD